MRYIVTAKETGERFITKDDICFEDSASYDALIEVDSSREYQTIMGFGGAFTEAAAVTLSKMSEGLQEEVITKYYDTENGLGYSLGRVHIHSCDFALGNYTYVEDGDTELKTFDIGRDRRLIIPLIQRAIQKRGAPLTILASPWSPPAWMKSNGSMNHGGKLLPEYADTWALYYTKFIEAYEKEGIGIWGLTVQNEPAAVQIWDSCIYSAGEERDFIRDHLGPMLQEQGYGDKKLLIWDHNRDVMVERASTVLNDPEAARYVWGTGFHWYVSEEFGNVGKVHDLFPDKHLLFTEGCQEGGCQVGEWFTGERYARNMIGDFNNWCEGYLDWNIVLDETGGPNHVNNLCDAPIIADTVNDRLHYNSSYYYIGHFSKYIEVGAKRICSDADIDGIHTASFRNPDGQIITVIMNEGDDDRQISVRVDTRFINLTISRHSIMTVCM